MATKVKLKFKDRGSKLTKAQVRNIAYNEVGVPFVRLYEIPEGYKALCKNDDDVDKLLSNEAKEEFDKNGITVVTPPEIRAKRSFFMRKLEEDVGKHTPEQFVYEIEDKNPWMTVTEVTKIKDYTHVVKIECKETAMVEKVLQVGLRIFNATVLPDQIAREEFISLLTCFNCYQYEDHTTFNCPNKEVKYCSECGGSGHKYYECTEIEQNCLNCIRNNERRTNHRTLAMSCPLKKRLINEKREEKKKVEEEKQNKTYAMVAKKTAQEISGEKTEIKLSEITHFKILASIMHAHVLNLQNPGCYRKELNIMLEQNGLPKMWFPDNPDSAAVLGSKTTAKEATEQIGATTTGITTQEGATAMARTEKPKEQRKSTRHLPMEIVEERPYAAKDKEGKRDPRKTTRRQEKEQTEQEEIETERHQEIGEIETYEVSRTPKTAEELGLTIYITNKQNFPTRQPKRNEIAKGIEKKTHKFVYDNRTYDEGYVEFLIKMEKLEITKEDFKLVDEAKYKKIRNGPSRGSPQETAGHKKVFKHGDY